MPISTWKTRMRGIMCFDAAVADRRIVGSGLLLAFFGAPALALNGDAGQGASEYAYIAELPVVLSVSRLAQPLADAPAAVTVIDRDMIRASGAREVWELMRLVPGYQVAPIVGGSPVVVYHGLTEEFPRRLQVLVDGRSQYSPFLLGGVNWNTIPVALDDIERIEVIRGSNAAAYGSNAFLGVVNIITSHAADQPGFSVAGKHGRQGVRDAQIRWAGRVGDAALRVTAEEHRDDGLDQQFDARQTRRLDLRGDFRFGARDELQVNLGAVETDIGVGEADSETNPFRQQNYENSFLQLVWRHNLGADEDLSLRYEHSREDGRDALIAQTTLSLAPRLPPVPLTVPLDFGYRSRRHNVEIQHTRGFGEGLRLVSGAGYRSDAVTSPGFFGRSDPVSLNVLRAFGNLEWRAHPKWLFNFGGTWEHDSLSGTTFSPRIAASYRLAEQQTVRLAAARAYRTPSLLEGRSLQRFQTLPVAAPPLPEGILRHGLVSNGVPAAERLDAFEIAYLGEWRPLKMRVDVRAFAEYVKDRIVTAPTALVPPNCDRAPPLVVPCGVGDSAANFQDARIRGVEYQLEWRPVDTTRLFLNQAFIRIASSYHDLPAGVTQVKLAEIERHADASAPTHASSLMLMQRLPLGFELAATLHAVGAMRWSNANYTPAYRRLDWRLAYSFKIGAQRGELSFTSQSDSKAHGEADDDELVTPRKFVGLRLEY